MDPKELSISEDVGDTKTSPQPLEKGDKPSIPSGYVVVTPMTAVPEKSVFKDAGDYAKPSQRLEENDGAEQEKRSSLWKLCSCG